MRLKFGVLGSLEVRGGDAVLPVRGAKQRLLLSALLMHANEDVSTELLVDTLWPGDPPSTVDKSLQVHISQLRKLLEPGRIAGGSGGLIITRPRGYSLQVNVADLDLLSFEQALDDAAKLVGAQETAAAFRSALACWRGPALADVEHVETLRGSVARLDELRLRALSDRIDADLVLGKHVAVIAELEGLAAEHPLRERLRFQLMLALYRSGRQADALETYRVTRGLLVDELGIEPSRDLRELEARILTQDPGLDAPVQNQLAIEPSETQSARNDSRSFVGRGRECILLEDALRKTKAGRGRLVLISGEAGIGKSRLAREFVGRAENQGARTLWGSCWEGGGAPAFWPWVQPLRAFVNGADTSVLRGQLGRGAADLANLVPELRDLFNDLAPEMPVVDSEGARFRLFDSISAFLRRASAAQPLVIVLDDVHAADISSLLLLEFVASELADARVLIVATYRDPELDLDDPRASALTDVGRKASDRISLAGLTPSEVASYVALSSSVETPPSLVDTIAADTQGNPLFVGEIVRLLESEEQLARPPTALWRPSIPETVKDVIGRRLERLPDGCRETLAVASVLGREFRLDLLELLTDHARYELLMVLDEPIRAKVIAEMNESLGQMRFTHALVRDTLYEALPRARRHDLHRQAGEAIETLATAGASSHLFELAHHFFHALPAVDPEVAVMYSQRAAEEASALLAHEEAARLYESAYSALRSGTSATPALELVLLLGRGDSLARSGDMAAARDVFLRAAAIARGIGATAELGAAALGYSGRIVWARAGDDRLIVPLLEEALAAQGEKITPLRARLLARLAGALRDERDPSRRVATGTLGVQIAQQCGDPRAKAYALAGLSGARHGIGPEGERLAIADELRQAALRLHDKEYEFEALAAELLVFFERGAMAEVHERLALITAIGEDLKQPSHQWFALTDQALIALHEGRLDEAAEYAERGFAIGQRAEPDIAEPTYALQIYELRRLRGQALDGDMYELLQRVARDHRARPLFSCALARIALETGQTSEARRLFEELASHDFDTVPRDNEWLLAANYLADVCRGLADTVRAASLYDLLLPESGKVVSDVAEGCAGSVHRPLGILASMLARTDEATEHLRAAVATNARINAHPYLAIAKADLAKLLMQGNGSEEASKLLAEASEIAERLGMAPLGTQRSRSV